MFSKLFYTFDNNIIKQCQFYFNYLPAELKIINRRLNFLSRLCLTNNDYCNVLDSKNSELEMLLSTYLTNANICDINSNVTKSYMYNVNWKFYLFKRIEAELNLSQ